MIYSLATQLTQKLSRKESMSEDEFETVTYGLFTVLSRVMYALISVLFGVILGCIFESLLFYFCFLFVKKYAGGFHAKTEIRCFVISTFSIISSVMLIYSSGKSAVVSLLILSVSLLCALVISFFAPIASKERPLDEAETKRYSKKAKIRASILFFLGLAFYLANLKAFSSAVFVSLILESVLLIAGKIAMMQQKKKQTSSF